ncbi:MAG: DEAD/DEAH box helicase [Anaeroplasmataceae bacterium]
MEEKKFIDLNVENDILNALNELEIFEPTEIQVAAIPVMLTGADLIGQAQTGTGKTFAYGIPTIMKVDAESKEIQALILCPTRELSLQVSNEVLKLIKYKKDIKIATIYGGDSYEKQNKALRRHPQIVIGTPGRIIDHMNRKTINFNNLTTLCLDEADEMLKMGFQDSLEAILSQTPSSRQTVLFSATMPDFIKKVAKKYQKSPEHIIIKKKSLTVDRIDQSVYYCKRESKLDLLIRLLDLNAFKSCIVFANTKSKVDEIVSLLQKNGYSVDGLHGDLKQMVRDRVMGSFRAGNINVLVATDVAARGIDVSGLESIINFDLPQEDEVYVHRIGRTGRAGLKGQSISIASSSEKRKVKVIEDFTKSQMVVKDIPKVEEINVRIYNKLFDKIMHNLDNDNSANKILFDKIAENNLDIDKVVNALIDINLVNYKKTYHTIEVISGKRSFEDNGRRGNSRSEGRDRDRNRDRDRGRDKDREKDSSRSDRRPSSKNYVYARLNIGKKELLRPQILLSTCEKLAGVKKENIGDIIIRKSGTTLEITKQAFTFLKKLEGKTYQGTPIKVFKADSLDE